MKQTLSLGFSVIVVLAGCSDNSKPSASATPATNTGSSSPLTAPVDYLRAVGNGQQSAVKTADTTSLNKAIQMFSVDRGRNPKDLQELVKEKYIAKIPEAPYGMKLVYDADAGTVSVAKQ